MVDTLFSDVSEFQAPVNDRYPYAVLSFRACDGTYKDHHFQQNLAWAKKSVASGKLKFFIVYFVWETNWQQTVATFKSVVGTPHPKMAVMIDVESWGGKISGNHSTGINAARESIISWLNSYRGNAVKRKLYKSRDRKRVIGYANAGDFANIWPSRGDTQLVIANYSYRPSSPKHLIHQFSSTFATPPFGKCDINAANGYTPTTLAKALGLDTVLGVSPAPATPKPSKPTVPAFPLPKGRVFGEHHPKYNGTENVTRRAQVQQLQQVLVKHGYAGKVNAAWSDGIYGPQTAKAVNAFRKSKHWPQAGDVGVNTWNALFKL